MGISSKTNLSIVHSSHSYGDLQIPTCWGLQGSLHLHLLTGHVQRQDMLGKHITQTMDYTYLHLGLEEQVTTYDYNIMAKHIPLTWLANTWNYISSLSGIVVNPLLKVFPQRQEDSTIMSTAIENMSGITLTRIQTVRLFLQVFFISDITNSAGTYISSEFLTPHAKRYRKFHLN